MSKINLINKNDAFLPIKVGKINSKDFKSIKLNKNFLIKKDLYKLEYNNKELISLLANNATNYTKDPNIFFTTPIFAFKTKSYDIENFFNTINENKEKLLVINEFLSNEKYKQEYSFDKISKVHLNIDNNGNYKYAYYNKKESDYIKIIPDGFLQGVDKYKNKYIPFKIVFLADNKSYKEISFVLRNSFKRLYGKTIDKYFSIKEKYYDIGLENYLISKFFDVNFTPYLFCYKNKNKIDVNLIAGSFFECNFGMEFRRIYEYILDKKVDIEFVNKKISFSMNNKNIKGTKKNNSLKLFFVTFFVSVCNIFCHLFKGTKNNIKNILRTTWSQLNTIKRTLNTYWNIKEQNNINDNKKEQSY